MCVCMRKKPAPLILFFENQILFVLPLRYPNLLSISTGKVSFVYIVLYCSNDVYASEMEKFEIFLLR